MAQKTLPTGVPVAGFIDSVPHAGRREDARTVMRLMEDVTGVAPVMWGPSIIGYGTYEVVSPSSRKVTGVWPRVGLSPRKSALTLYGLKDSPEAADLLGSLGSHTEGAGCVYVKRVSDVSQDVLRELVRIGWELDRGI